MLGAPVTEKSEINLAFEQLQNALHERFTTVRTQMVDQLTKQWNSVQNELREQHLNQLAEDLAELERRNQKNDTD